MDILLNNPGILTHAAYLFLAGGLILTALAIFSPGTGALEIAAIFCLALAGVGMYALPVNWWALIVLLIGAVFFIISLRRADTWLYLAASIGALVIGSAYLFQGEKWWLPAVHPLVAAAVSVFSGGFFWLATRKYIEAANIRPTHDLDALIGALGEAKSAIHDEGSVQVAGELWSAHSKKPIPSGAPLRVVSRSGFSLVVEEISEDRAE